MPRAFKDVPFATVARQGENIAGRFDNVSGPAMCSDGAESRTVSNVTMCPEEVLNTTKSSEQEFSCCATDSHKSNTDDMPFLKSSGDMSQRF